jgi:regulator of sigma E protease
MILSIVIALITLSIIIFVHELFHFIIAKASSIDAPVFSIGFGPKLFSFNWQGTEFRISLIPFGGYVQLKGMEPNEIQGREDEFYSKNPFIRIAVVFGGPFANILFGFLLYLGIFSIYGVEIPDTTLIDNSINGSNLLAGDKILKIDGKEISNWVDIINNLKNNSKVLLNRSGEEKVVVVDTINIDSLIPRFPPVVGMVDKGGPAYLNGIREGSKILKINDEEIAKWDDITNIISPAAGESLDILYTKNSDTILTKVVPEEQQTLVGDSVISRGFIGIIALTKRVNIPFSKALVYASEQTLNTGALLFRSIRLLITRKVSARSIAGPIGIVMLTERQMRWGLINLLFFVGLISVNLAIVNLFPIPPLDGFHIVVSIVSGIVRRKPSKDMIKVISAIGTAILIALMVFIVFNDILRIFTGNV